MCSSDVKFGLRPVGSILTKELLAYSRIEENFASVKKIMYLGVVYLIFRTRDGGSMIA